MIPDLTKISIKLAKDFKNIDTKSKNLLQVLICGSYKDKKDLEVIMKLRDMQHKKGINGVFLMKDIEIVDEKGNKIEVTPHQKMQLLWKQMKEGDNIPIFILYAGKSANNSLGLNAEIQTIANDKEKIDCAHLFKVPGSELVSHEKCFSNVKDVKDGDDFIIYSDNVIAAYVRQAKMYYQSQKEIK